MSKLRDDYADEFAKLKESSLRTADELRAIFMSATKMSERDAGIIWRFHRRNESCKALAEDSGITAQRVSQIVARGLRLLQRHNR